MKVLDELRRRGPSSKAKSELSCLANRMTLTPRERFRVVQ
jgi:hypothetical protein